MTGHSGPPRRRRQAGYRRSRTRRHWLDSLPLISLGVLVLAVCAVAVVASQWLTPVGRPISVPPFIGMPFDQARSLAAAAHLELREIAHRPDYHAPKDSVIGQLPNPGEKVREGRVIDVITSDGVPTVKVPNLSNLSLRDATVALENAHLSLGTVSESVNQDLTAGDVLEQHPDPFAAAPAGSEVSVTVAKGRPQMYAPSFVGMPIQSARQAAHDAHVVFGTVTSLALAAGAKPKGMIVAQDPVPGTLLGPKQKIALQVSGGAPPTAAPSPPPSPLAQAPSPTAAPTSVLPSPGAARTMRISVALPQSSAAQPVKVVLEDATGSKTIFDQTTDGGVTLSFDVTVVGQGTIETYVNGKLVSSTPL